VTHSASEVFTMQLARAAGRQANKFLINKGLQRADRDDVISAAMLWCWENRDNYSLTTTLETWFMYAVRHSLDSWRANELPISDDSIDNIGGEDTTYNTAEAESAADALINALTAADKEIALLTMKGYTRREMVKMGHDQYMIDNAHARIKQLRRLLPDDRVVRSSLRAESGGGNSDDASDTLSPIDVELEQLEFAPPAGKDCPPCWRCQWYYGFMPSGKRETRMDIEDLEVREAVKNTEARKIEIAQRVRSGL
jgi:hypothetical protein